jgi:glucose-1-phosphate adenylyltransferase
MRDTLAVVLGGGAGSRLFPLTRDRSKPAVPLGGKYRLIDIPISNCVNSELWRIFVLTQYNSASLNRHVAQAYRFDRFGGGFVTILAAEQTPTSDQWFQGTADAVRQCLHHIEAYPHRRVLILSGDQLYRMDFNVLAQHHHFSRADLTVATIPVTADEAPSFGILKTDANGVITEFHEKPARDQLDGLESPVTEALRRQGRVFLASMGIYLFERTVLRTVLTRDPAELDFGKQVIPRTMQTHRVVSYPFDDYWSDIGTIGSFYEANLDLARRRPAFDLYDTEQPIFTNARMLPPAKFQQATLRDAMVGEACVVLEATVEESVIGIRTFIDVGAEVRRTVALGADYYAWHEPGARGGAGAPANPGIGPGAVVEGAILDMNVRVGASARLTNAAGIDHYDDPGGLYYIRDGIIVVPKNTVIPDGMEV